MNPIRHGERVAKVLAAMMLVGVLVAVFQAAFK